MLENSKDFMCWQLQRTVKVHNPLLFMPSERVLAFFKRLYFKTVFPVAPSSLDDTR